MTREPGPVKGGKTVIAFIEDPDGYKFELLERGPTPEPLCQVMLRVGDLDRAINFYEKVKIVLRIRNSFLCYNLIQSLVLNYSFWFEHNVWRYSCSPLPSEFQGFWHGASAQAR